MTKSRLRGSLVALFFLLMSPLSWAAAPGITERTGHAVPLEAVLKDESGRTVILGSLLGKPAILSFAYFNCEDVCNTALSNMADTLGRMDSSPGNDFVVLTVSIDEADRPGDAAYKKKNYMKAAGRQMDQGAWRFLTGDRASIEAVSSAVGFGFAKTEKGFDHPAALAILSPDGRIIRYIYGSSYLPADIEMALLEAREGRLAASIQRALVFCFSDEPGGRSYVRGVLKAAGVATLVFAAGLYIYLAASRKPGKKDPE